MFREKNVLFLENAREAAAFAITTGLEQDFYRVEPTLTSPNLRIVFEREIDAQDALTAVQEILDKDRN